MLMQEMCDYVSDNWHEQSPFHLAAYVMWRINWIHPFPDGNGRTSRIASYVVLSTALGNELPGAPSIPQQIQNNRTNYFKALEEADAAAREQKIDVTAMEEMLKNMLANQLLSVIEAGDKINH
jgi:Fic family protein